MRFVVVEIPDNAEADAFVAAIENDNLIFGIVTGQTKVDGRMVDEVQYNSPESEWKVPAMYGVPTLFCDCPDWGGKGVRTQKYGWYVHAKCAKPRPTSTQYPHNLIEAAAGRTGLKQKTYTLGFRPDRLSAFGQ